MNEAQNASAPTIFWFQGGPGCSSLFGLLQESGPIRISTTPGVLDYNDLAWTKFANVVYLEQPIGVGFSYATDPEDYSTNSDTRAALEAANAISQLLTMYTPLAAGDLYISGESYGGTYVPMTTSELHSLGIYPTGMLIGNPFFNCNAHHTAGFFKLMYWHGMVSQTLFDEFEATNCDPVANTTQCQHLFNLAVAQSGIEDQQLSTLMSTAAFPSWDPDNLFEDFCTGNASLDTTNTIGAGGVCMPLGNLLQYYLNLPTVQLALGVIDSLAAPITPWSGCTENPKFQWNYNGGSMKPYLEKFFSQSENPMKILIFSGDLDIQTCPFPFTMSCLHSIEGLENEIVWSPWFVNGHTAGYVEVFDKYTYATVKGGGHEVPYYQPASSWHMYRRFIESGSLAEPSSVAHAVPAKVKVSNGKSVPSLKQTRKSLKQSQQLRRMLALNGAGIL